MQDLLGRLGRGDRGGVPEGPLRGSFIIRPMVDNVVRFGFSWVRFALVNSSQGPSPTFWKFLQNSFLPL